MSGTTLPDRAVLRLAGEDVRGFLQGLVTNDVAGPLPVWAALLTAQGKVLFDFLVWEQGDDLLLDCEEPQADALARRLALYRLRRPITIARDEALAVHWSPQGEQGAPDPRHPALGRRWLAPAAAPAEGWPARRLSLGVCEGAAELGGVSFAKGCYVGQENTARMNWRAKVNRRLAVVPADTAPEDARAWHPELRLAVVHRRVEALRTDPAILRPDWLMAALTSPPPQAGEE